MEALRASVEQHRPLPAAALAELPVLNAYTLICWTLGGKAKGHGYGFPFGPPTSGLRRQNTPASCRSGKTRQTQLRGQWQDNRPYFKALVDLKRS